FPTRRSSDLLEKVSANRKKEWYTIGEAAKEVDVASSAIRHWEKEGLITPVRNQESGYRNYSAADVRKLFVIRTLRQAVYSLDIVREVLEEVDQNNMTHAIKIACDSLIHMDNLIKEQLRGMYYLYRLCDKVCGEK